MLPTILLSLIAGISILLMLVRPRGIAEVYWVTGGAVLLVVCHLMPLRAAVSAIAQGSDVYLFLAGMMLLSELAREHGVFDWLSSVAIRHAQGSASRLFLLVYAIGTFVTIFLSNDATAVVLTPAILTAARKAKVQPLPCLFACAFVANAASFVLPISNPANLVVFRQHMPSPGRWLADFGVPSLLSITVTYSVLRFLFRNDLRATLQQSAGATPLSRNGRWVLAGILLMVVVLLAASALHQDLGLPTCGAAVMVTAILCLRARTNPLRLARAISWQTLLLVAGLFILVRAVEGAGALRATQAALNWALHVAPAAGACAAGFCVAVANNLVNNLPLGLLAGATLETVHAQGLIARAVLIGVDLGPNLSVTGSLATILWLIVLRREKVDIRSRDFLKAGLVAMPAALIASIAAALLMQKWFGV